MPFLVLNGLFVELQQIVSSKSLTVFWAEFYDKIIVSSDFLAFKLQFHNVQILFPFLAE
jgi:hypothetical protein